MADIKSPSKLRRSIGGGEDLDDKLEDLKKRFHLLEGDKRAYYETSQWTLQSNKERISALRAENKQLYQQLTHLQRVVMAHLEGNNEAERMAYHLRETRKKYDDIKAKVDEKLQVQNRLKDTLRALMMETPNPTEGVTQQANAARVLEQKIEKASLKYAEALTVKRTYEQILSHLQEDRIGYDSHVDSLEMGVQAKDKELVELTTLYQDALRSKEYAKDELAKCESLANQDKRRRDQSLEEKKQRIKQLMDSNARMERKVKREEQKQQEARMRSKALTPTSNHSMDRDADYYKNHLRDLTASYQRLSVLAGSGNHLHDMNALSDINALLGENALHNNQNDMDLIRRSGEDGIVATEVGGDASSLNCDVLLNHAPPNYDAIAQYLATQAEITRTLETHQAKASARLEALKSERATLADTVASARLRQLVPPGTRKQVDSYEARLAQANAAYVRARLKYERAAKANGAILAGISSLASKLQFVEPGENFSEITDQNLPEVIQLCKKKIEHIVSTKPALPTSSSTKSLTRSPSAGALTPFPPQFTIRIKQPNPPQILSVDDIDTDEFEVVPTRESVKSFSAAIVERELKKTKRKQKKHSSSGNVNISPGGGGSQGGGGGGDKRTPPPTHRNYSPSSTSRTARAIATPLSARPTR